MCAMPASDSSQLRVLVAGGGVAALEAILALRSLAARSRVARAPRPSAEFAHRPVLRPHALHRRRRTANRVRSHARQAPSRRARRSRHRPPRSPDRRRRPLPYDRLIVATGAQPVDGVPGATMFRGPISAGAVEGAIARARERVIFTLPAGGQLDTSRLRARAARRPRPARGRSGADGRRARAAAAGPVRPDRLGRRRAAALPRRRRVPRRLRRRTRSSTTRCCCATAGCSAPTR